MIKIQIETYDADETALVCDMLRDLQQIRDRNSAERRTEWAALNATETMAAQAPVPETIVLSNDDQHAGEAPKTVKRVRKSAPPKDETPAPAAEQAPETLVPSPESPASPSEAPAAPTYTLEQVRAQLAALSQAGKKDGVVALLRKYNANKLTDLPADVYPALMAEAEGL